MLQIWDPLHCELLEHGVAPLGTPASYVGGGLASATPIGHPAPGGTHRHIPGPGQQYPKPGGHTVAPEELEMPPLDEPVNPELLP